MKSILPVLTALLLAPLAALHAESPVFVTPQIRAPRVQFQTFNSVASHTQVSFHLYTPEVYDTEKERRFPVLYWLHGSGGGLQGIPVLSAWFDVAIREGKIPPMLVVFPNGLASSMWCDSKDGAVPMETITITELIPHIDATFRSIAKHEGRIVEGFSMGGYGAARLGFKYPELFAAVSILAGGPLDWDFAGPRANANPAERERIFKTTFGNDLDYYRAQHPITIAEQRAAALRDQVRVRIAVGARDFSEPLNRAYSEHLMTLNIAHTFTIVPDVRHDTLALLKGLAGANWEFYRSIFSAPRVIQQSSKSSVGLAQLAQLGQDAEAEFENAYGVETPELRIRAEITAVPDKTAKPSTESSLRRLNVLFAGDAKDHPPRSHSHDVLP